MKNKSESRVTPKRWGRFHLQHSRHVQKDSKNLTHGKNHNVFETATQIEITVMLKLLRKQNSRTFLIGFILTQWIFIIYLLQGNQTAVEYNNCPSKSFPSPETDRVSSKQSRTKNTTAAAKKEILPSNLKIERKWNGVAATLALRSPKWFHRRYTAMIHNVLDNTPEDWALQIFVNADWWTTEILKLHRGIHLLMKNKRIIVTEVPPEFKRYKPKQVLIQSWFWEQMIADHIFLFSGNGVMCSHTLVPISFFNGIDFCGGPSRGNAEGGDGSTHSIRSRRAMLDAIKFGNPDKDTIGSESSFFISALKKINSNNAEKQYRLATKNETILFAGGADLITSESKKSKELRLNYESYGPSLVMSGTGNNLDWTIRDTLLQICPEWKVIFPSLHDPNCFGASPNAKECAASICALKPDRPKSGC